MPVHGVVAEIGEPACVPPRERRSAVVQDALARRVPVDQTGFFAPEGLTLLDGTAMELVICTHAVSSGYCVSRQRLHFIGRLVRARDAVLLSTNGLSSVRLEEVGMDRLEMRTAFDHSLHTAR